MQRSHQASEESTNKNKNTEMHPIPAIFIINSGIDYSCPGNCPSRSLAKVRFILGCLQGLDVMSGVLKRVL